jgi:hypothetical protein
MQMKSSPAVAFARGQLSYSMVTAALFATATLLGQASKTKSTDTSNSDTSTGQARTAARISETKGAVEPRLGETGSAPEAGSSSVWRRQAWNGSIGGERGTSAGAVTRTGGALEGSRDGRVREGATERVAEMEEEVEAGSALVAGYAAMWGADASAIWASLVFTWQTCQKMLLQEANRCDARS